MIDYIQETFETADIEPAELRANPGLLERLVEIGMRVTRGQANPHILAHELKQAAENA